MKNRFAERLRAAEFDPHLLGMLSNPFYFARKALRAEVAAIAPRIKGRLLDIGCGQKPYRALFDVEEYVGLEIDRLDNRRTKAADYFYDGRTMPFPDASFDVSLCNQVLEHVFEPTAFLAEIRRVLRPGGQLLLTVPFVWDEHEQPWDYARYTTFGLLHLLEKSGFDVLEQRRSGCGARTLFQLCNAYLYRITRSHSRAMNAVACILLIAPINVMGELVSRLLPRNPELYLDQVVLARRRPDAA
jgi:SAM-dependent methyltransferase